MSTPGADAPARRSLVHHADFRHLWAGDALGQFGAMLTAFALPVFAVQSLHATEWQMGLLNAAESSAFLIIGLPAGAWVDRMLKRRVLILADLARAALLAGLVVTAVTGHASIPLLIGVALGYSVATVFFDVAHQSYVPGLVGLEHIMEGNAKLQATQSVAQVGAPAVGGLLLRVMAAPWLIAFNVGAYLVSAVLVARIRKPETLPSPESRRPLRTEIWEGLSFVIRQPLLRRIVACTSIGNLGNAAAYAVSTIFVLRTLGLEPAVYGLIGSASAAGGLLAALFAERITRVIGEGRAIPWSAVAMGAAFALTPLAALVPAAPEVPLIAGGFLFSWFVVLYNVAQVSYRQRLCPPALLGRMNASVRFIVWGTVPIGGLLGGALGTALGVLPTLWFGVALISLSALPVLLSPMRTMRDLPTPDHAASVTD